MAEFLDVKTSEEVGFGAVLALLQPITPAGQRLKKALRPFLPNDQSRWQKAMQDLQLLRVAMGDRKSDGKANADGRKLLQEALRELPDVVSLLVLLEQGGPLRQVDFFEIKAFLWHGLAIERLFAEMSLSFAWWPTVAWEALLRLLNPTEPLLPTFALAEFPDPQLVALRQEMARLQAAIFTVKKEQSERLRSRYRKAPNRDGEYVWDRQDRAMVEQARADAELVLLQENLFEAVYRVVEPESVRLLQREMERVRSELEAAESQLLQRLADKLRPQVQTLRLAEQALARLDWTLAKVVLAQNWQAGEAVWETEASAVWQVQGGWHPVVRASVEQRGGNYTPLDLELAPGVGLITGPNMGGKTIALKTFGLLQALAQHAFPIPAARFAFHPVERIGMSGGDAQSMVTGLSSFGAEMQRIGDLLQTRGPALLLLDEVARTTNPQEGEALAVGLAAYLQSTPHTALFATHFPKAAQVAGCQKFRIAGLRPDALARLEQAAGTDDLLVRLQDAMDYRLLKQDDTEVPHEAVRLAKFFGLPDAVLAKTKELLATGNVVVDGKGAVRRS